jgi:hypothetical protein
MLSVVAVGVVVGLVVGFGLGYRLGGIAPPPPPPSPSPTPSPFPEQPSPVRPYAGDLQADGVSARLQASFESAAPSGWAVCGLEDVVECNEIVPGLTDPRVPPSEYGLGWYGNRELTRVEVAPADFVVAAHLGKGAAAAWLSRMGPGDIFLEKVALTPVNPGRNEAFYFDLGALGPGHYVVEVDFMAVPEVGEYRMAQTYVAGFVVLKQGPPG